MAKAKQLTRRQSALIEDLFASEGDEQKILDKHNVSRRLYFRWLADEAFAEQLDRQVAVAYRRSRLLVTRNAPLAASRLVDLTKCDKKETARKACLDIIRPDPAIHSTETATAQDVKSPEPAQISPQTASRLLAALAEQNDD
ncbi:MAG: hypothetical protein ACYSWO_00625 [Planctomycetota bacterium]|jgi:hypothetical protein